MKKINFTNATVTAQASVEIDGVSHDVTSAVIEGGTLPTPDNINQLQNNVEEAILNPVVESIECKNKFDMNGNILESIGYTSGTNTLESGKIKSTANIANGNGKGQIIQLKPNAVYTYSVKISGFEVSGSTCLRISPVNSEGNAVGYLVDQNITCEVGKVYSYSFTTSDTGKIWVMLNGISNSDDYSILKYIVYDYVQIEEGSTATSYTSFKRYGYNNKESMGSIVVDDISCKNLFNKNNVLIGYFINLSGVQIASENMCMTNYYIEVNPNTEYTFSSNVVNYLYIAEYNSSKEFIKSTGIDGTDKEITITTDIGTKYVIASCSKHYLDGMQFEEGTVATKHSNYKGIGYTSGRNENGSWVKYDDGRMECFGELLYENVAIINADYGTYYAQLDPKPFAMSFKSNPICVMQVDSVAPAYALWLRSTDTGASTTKTNRLLVTSMASCTANKIKIHYHAIGRWK